MQEKLERFARESKKYLVAVSATAILGISGGCATQGAITDTSCQSYEPIRASVQDTDYTKRQVIAHNAVYDKLCGANPLK